MTILVALIGVSGTALTQAAIQGRKNTVLAPSAVLPIVPTQRLLSATEVDAGLSTRLQRMQERQVLAAERLIRAAASAPAVPTPQPLPRNLSLPAPAARPH
ncbi:MAG: hypothetical protein HY270_17030 [Deltaproteobacteria bacterium]|nr:hypothetical protein [Deltaproteobacteria bacterium]